MDLVVLAPVYNDWESLACLMGELAGVKPKEVHWAVYAVNDGSSQTPETIAVPEGLSLNILHLYMNLGQQRNINIGWGLKMGAIGFWPFKKPIPIF